MFSKNILLQQNWTVSKAVLYILRIDELKTTCNNKILLPICDVKLNIFVITGKTILNQLLNNYNWKYGLHLIINCECMSLCNFPEKSY